MAETRTVTIDENTQLSPHIPEKFREEIYGTYPISPQDDYQAIFEKYAYATDALRYFQEHSPDSTTLHTALESERGQSAAQLSELIRSQITQGSCETANQHIAYVVAGVMLNEDYVARGQDIGMASTEQASFTHTAQFSSSNGFNNGQVHSPVSVR